MAHTFFTAHLTCSYGTLAAKHCLGLFRRRIFFDWLVLIGWFWFWLVSSALQAAGGGGSNHLAVAVPVLLWHEDHHSQDAVCWLRRGNCGLMHGSGWMIGLNGLNQEIVNFLLSLCLCDLWCCRMVFGEQVAPKPNHFHSVAIIGAGVGLVTTF